jgi:hypothetical protein
LPEERFEPHCHSERSEGSLFYNILRDLSPLLRVTKIGLDNSPLTFDMPLVGDKKIVDAAKKYGYTRQQNDYGLLNDQQSGKREGVIPK